MRGNSQSTTAWRRVCWAWSLAGVLLNGCGGQTGTDGGEPETTGPTSSENRDSGQDGTTTPMGSGRTSIEGTILTDGVSPECAVTSACRNSGQCTWDGARCWKTAGADADCEPCDVCSLYGRCHAVDGFCKASGDQDCLDSKTCSESGKCMLADGRCVSAQDACTGIYDDGECHAAAAFDEVCKESPRCRYGDYEARCTLKHGYCQTTSDQDCAQSSGCTSLGACFFGLGGCYATDESCAAVSICKVHGKCESINGVCQASEEGCQNSTSCATHGACSLLVKSKSCGTRESGVCHAGSAADCEQAETCTKDGRCSLCVDEDGQGSCRADCSEL